MLGQILWGYEDSFVVCGNAKPQGIRELLFASFFNKASHNHTQLVVRLGAHTVLSHSPSGAAYAGKAICSSLPASPLCTLSRVLGRHYEGNFASQSVYSHGAVFLEVEKLLHSFFKRQHTILIQHLGSVLGFSSVFCSTPSDSAHIRRLSNKKKLT